MADAPQSQTTDLLLEHGAGEDTLDRLFPAVYDELRRIARIHMRRERSNHTLATTELVHEAYLNLIDQTRIEWKDKTHFLAIASRAMRRLLIDYARRKKAKKRGGDRGRITLDNNVLSVDAQATELLSLDKALATLAEHHERMAEIVECRFFGGMSTKETASALDVSTRTVERDWSRAKAHLHRMMNA